MVANKDYWRGAPKIDEVIFQTYQNQDTMAQDLKTGAIQSGWNIPSAQFDAAEQRARPRGHPRGHDRLRPARLQLRRPEEVPQVDRPSRAAGPGVPQRPAVGRRQGQDRLHRLQRQRRARPTRSSPGTSTRPTPTSTCTPPSDPYTFDLEKAKAALDAAGYTDGDGNGIREYKGKDIKLRLYARTESPESQNCGKLITGWFEEVGLDIDYQVIDDGALGDKQYNYDGDEFAPDFDLFIWGWGGDVDPNFILSILTTGSIESWSDCNWSNAEYDKLFLEQQTTIDVQERIAIVQQMQQIVYDESPYIPLVYPLDLEAANKGTWTGWVRANDDKGAWWYNTQPDTYVAVHPGSAAPAETGGGSSTGLIVGDRGRGRRRHPHRRAAAAATRQGASRPRC